MNPSDLSALRAARSAIGDRANRALSIALLALGSVAFLVPLYVMVTIALKSPAEFGSTSVWAWPQKPTMENFHTVLTNPNVSFQLFFKNTVIVTVISSIGTLAGSCVVAYAFARMRFPGRDRLFLILLSTMILPGVVTQIPSYVMFSKIGWINTFWPLILPPFLGGGAFNVFLLRQFYMGLPRELDEAAILDGAGHWKVFTRVVLPLSGPALATVGLFAFIGSWRDFFGPLLYFNDPDKQTLELGLQTYHSLLGEKWNLLMAGSVLVTIPLIVIFFVGQRYFVKGIVMSGLK